MLSFDALLPFLVAASVLTLAPGPDNMMVLSLGVSRGARVAMGFALGCALGCVAHTLWVALGVAALLESSPSAVWVLKLVGAAYLVYLAVLLIRNRNASTSLDNDVNSFDSVSRNVLRGFVANAINPKVALFFLAFLPQFVSSEGGQAGWLLLQLGMLFSLQTVLWFGLIAVASGYLSRGLNGDVRLSAMLNIAAAAVFVLLAIALFMD